jgi:glycine cleavage system regulatory protein
MHNQFVMTIVSDDKPGIVELIANAVSRNYASWQESSFSQLAGKFAGVVQIGVEESHREPLLDSLNALEQYGIQIHIDACSPSQKVSKSLQYAKFSAIGPDRKGIIKEFSQAFAKDGVNIDEMETRLSSMPYSGDPLFEAKGFLAIPEGVDLLELEEKLRNIADSLALDFALNQNMMNYDGETA